LTESAISSKSHSLMHFLFLIYSRNEGIWRNSLYSNSNSLVFLGLVQLIAPFMWPPGNVSLEFYEKCTLVFKGVSAVNDKDWSIDF